MECFGSSALRGDTRVFAVKGTPRDCKSYFRRLCVSNWFPVNAAKIAPRSSWRDVYADIKLFATIEVNTSCVR